MLHSWHLAAQQLQQEQQETKSCRCAVKLRPTRCVEHQITSLLHHGQRMTHALLSVFPQVDLEAGKRVSWCSCGLSERQPFCDGKHKGVSLQYCSSSKSASVTHTHTITLRASYCRHRVEACPLHTRGRPTRSILLWYTYAPRPPSPLRLPCNQWWSPNAPGCKETKTPPFCDGSHNALKAE